MLTQRQKEEHQFLEKEVRKREKYLNWIPLLQKSAIVILFLAYTIMLILIYFFSTFQIAGIIGMGGLLYFIVVIVVNESVLLKKAQDVSPSNDRLTIYHTYAIIDNIANYFNKKMADSIKEKEKFKNNAIKNAHSLLAIIEKNWYVGDFKLGKKILGETISEFKDRLFKRLILNFEGASDAFLKEAEAVFYNFAVFLDYPTKEGLENINDMMKDFPESCIPEKKPLLSSFLNQPIRNKILVLIGSAIFLFPLGTYYVAVNYFGSAISDAFNTSMTIGAGFAVLFFAEIISILRSREKKEK